MVTDSMEIVDILPAYPPRATGVHSTPKKDATKQKNVYFKGLLPTKPGPQCSKKRKVLPLSLSRPKRRKQTSAAAAKKGLKEASGDSEVKVETAEVIVPVGEVAEKRKVLPLSLSCPKRLKRTCAAAARKGLDEASEDSEVEVVLDEVVGCVLASPPVLPGSPVPSAASVSNLLKNRKKITRIISDMELDESNNSVEMLDPLLSPCLSQKKTVSQRLPQKHLQQPTSQQQLPARPILAQIPPAIFLHDVTSIQPLIESLRTTDGIANNFSCTNIRGKVIKINCLDTSSYKRIMARLDRDQRKLHTHQPRRERGYRVILRNLHHSTPSELIREQICELGFKVRYLNVLTHRGTRKPMDMFEVELEPTLDGSNDRILSVTTLGNQRIKVERQMRRILPTQCFRCQQFGHSKNYCRRPFVCLKCAGAHPSTECSQTRIPNPICANCGKGHIASYRGCEEFKKAQAKLLSYRVHLAGNIPRGKNDNGSRPGIRHNRELRNGKRSSNTSLDHQQPLRNGDPRPTYSQIVKNGNQSTRLENPAERHLENFQRRLRSERNSNGPNPFRVSRPQQQDHAPQLLHGGDPGQTFSKVARGGNSTSRLRNPAERHLVNFQRRLRFETDSKGLSPSLEGRSQQQSQQQPLAPQLQQCQQPEGSQKADQMMEMVQQSILAVTEMGKKIDALLVCIHRLISSNLIKVNPTANDSANE